MTAEPVDVIDCDSPKPRRRPPAVPNRGVPRPGLSSLWPYLRDHRPTLTVVAVLSLIGAGASLLTPLLTRRTVDVLGAGQSATVPLGLLVISILIGAALSGVIRYLLERTAQGVVLGARVRLASRLLRLPIAEFDRRRTGDLISRVGADTTLLSAVVTSGLVELASGAVVIVGAIILMAVVDVLLLAVTLTSVVVGVGAVVLVARRIRPLSEQAQAAVGSMTASVERVLGAVRTVRASRAEDRETENVAIDARAAYDAGLKVARVQAVVGPLASVAVQSAFLAVVGIGGARVAARSISVADLVAFVLLLFLLIQPLAQGISAYTTIQTGLGALTRIEEVLSLPAEDANDPLTAPPISTAMQTPVLELDNVSFSYADGTQVLHEVSFTVLRGTRVALVGPSGAGKSTLLSLIERFYDTTDGQLRFEGTDIASWPRQALRSRIGYVEQDAPVLAGTIRDNLLMIDPTASDAQLRDVLAAVNLTDLIDRAPSGLDTPVGDEGVLLSGGERQRLAIARVLLAAPPLLLLDEPTASLDARNEAALRAAVDVVAEQRTLVIVAHRLSTVVDADAIVVLDKGRVVAIGTHSELLDTSPLYREFASQQLLV